MILLFPIDEWAIFVGNLAISEISFDLFLFR